MSKNKFTQSLVRPCQNQWSKQVVTMKTNVLMKQNFIYRESLAWFYIWMVVEWQGSNKNSCRNLCVHGSACVHVCVLYVGGWKLVTVRTLPWGHSGLSVEQHVHPPSPPQHQHHLSSPTRNRSSRYWLHADRRSADISSHRGWRKMLDQNK